MKKLELEELEKISGGFAWGSFLAGVGCGVGLATAETGLGLLVAAGCCATSFVSD